MASYQRKWFCQAWHYHNRKHFSCWSLRHQSQCMCTHPLCANIFCHADSCLPSLLEEKQWYLTMVSFVSSGRTYCGRILSVPSRSSSLMDVDFANVKYMQTGSVVVLVMSIRKAKQNTCKQVPSWYWSRHTGRQNNQSFVVYGPSSWFQMS